MVLLSRIRPYDYTTAGLTSAHPAASGQIFRDTLDCHRVGGQAVMDVLGLRHLVDRDEFEPTCCRLSDSAMIVGLRSQTQISAVQ
jgi:hypothetical protein